MRYTMDAPEILVRQFLASEWRSYRDFRLRALSDSPNAFATTYEESKPLPDENWERRFASSSANRELPLVAEVQGEFVGMAWARIEASVPATAHIYQMWVAPTHRKKGVGRKLLVEMIDWSKLCGARRIVLGVTCGDSFARRLYTWAGFVATGNPEPLRPMSELLVQNMSMEVSPDAA